MTIQYHDQDKKPHHRLDPRYRHYMNCPQCGTRCRANWRLTRHLELYHGIEVKRY